MNLKSSHTPNLLSGDISGKKQEIRNYFIETWELHEKLYTQLKSDEIFYHRGDPLRHIILFYFGHTAVFFINKLYLAKIIDSRIDPELESIFAIGVDEMSWDDLNNENYNWPTVDAVRAYRDEAKNKILKIIDETPLKLPIKWENPFWVIMMGIEHERIHLETSSVLIRQLPLEEVVADRFGQICEKRGETIENSMVKIPVTDLRLGKSKDHAFYGWDNEFGKLHERVDEFEASQMLISNGEFLKFIQDSGYETERFWTEEGWQWKNFKKAEMPLFWRKKEDKYFLRLVAQEIPMPWDWPVEVNYLEAKAFCEWKTEKENKKFRLPTEAEWYAIHQKSGLNDVDAWGVAPANINLEHYSSPCPVNQFQHGEFYDVIGNVWQWTETPITGFPGFKVHPFYDDFSTPTFDGKHNLMKGGSWISTGNEATYHARYAFRRHFYQHAGFRIIQSEQAPKIPRADYETDEEVAQSCETNWGDTYSRKPLLAVQLRDLIVKIFPPNAQTQKILDLNAGTGRLAFELAKYYNDITALDFSARMIKMPVQLQEQGFMRYIAKDEGDLNHFREVVLKDYNLGQNKDKIKFIQGDVLNLKPQITGYDLIIIPQLLTQLREPARALKDLYQRVNAKGKLLIISDYDWVEEKTPKQNWLGGYKKDGEPVTTLDGIETILSPHFNRDKELFEIIVSDYKNSRVQCKRRLEASIWVKKD